MTKLGNSSWHRLNRALAIVRAEYDYHKPSFSGEELRIETWLSDCDRKVSLNRNFRLYREHELLVSGTWKLYCIRLHTGKISRLPAEFRDCYLPAMQMIVSRR